MSNQSLILAVLAIVLLVATISDIRRHRIPNSLTFGAALVAVVLHTINTQLEGFLLSAGGFATGLLLFMPFYISRGMAAGDVKLMAATGAFLGAKLTLAAIAGSLLMGGVLALAYLTLRGGHTTFARYGFMAKTLVTTFRPIYIKAQSGEVATQRFPYALAIFSGTALGLWWMTDTVFGIAV